jgi:urease accessory protein
MAGDPLDAQAGATSPDPAVVVCRALAPGWSRCSACGGSCAPAGAALLWQLDEAPPRIWRM